MSAAYPTYDEFMKYWILSVMLSLVMYGVAFTLCISCIDILRKPTDVTKKQRNKVLIGFVLAMLCISTANVVSTVVMVVNALFSTTFDGNIRGGASTICLVLANWGADGFLVRISSVQ